MRSEIKLSNKPLSDLEISLLEKILIPKRRNHNSLRLLIYLGNSRPRGRVDFGIELIKKLDSEGHYIAGIIVEDDDPIKIFPEVKIKKILTLPKILAGPTSVIKKNIYNTPENDEEFCEFLEKIKSCQADVGIVFFGYWIPPEIFTIPYGGFLNYHPGPLPFLRGMEPDTFAILEGWKKIWGTLHKVESTFDTGNIITRSKTIRISRKETPVSLLKKLTEAGIESVIRTLRYLYKNKCYKNIVLQKGGSQATLKMAYEQSFINWNSDTNEILERKLRAFCGQNISIRLKASFEEEFYIVYDMEFFTGKFHGKPGNIVGYYAGKSRFLLQPIVKTLDGVAILLLGAKINGQGYPEDGAYEDWIIPPRSRKRETRKFLVKKSMLIFNNLFRS